MGLPTKKQLHKHKRGTRKALDTLDALGADVESQLIEEVKIPNPTTKKKSKTKVPNKKSTKDKDVASQSKPAVIIQKGEVPDLKQEEPQVELAEKKAAASDTVKEQTADSVAQNMKFSEQKSDQSAMETKLDFNDDETDSQQDKYLTFSVGKEIFGIEIKNVTEIIVVQKITSVPDTASFIKGVINLRGKVIPVMDVRERFGLETKEYDERTCIIVVNHNDLSVGLIVDIVNEVVDIPASDIDPPPNTHSGIKTNYLAGMGKVGAEVTILLNIHTVLDNGSFLRPETEDS